MWEIENISTKKRHLDFSSSGQGTFVGTAVYSNDQLVFNQIESIENHGEDDQVFQAIICEHCGYPHCEPGNWIALRKAGKFFLFLPAFEWIIEEEESLKSEYLPPNYISTNGATVLTPETYEQLQELITPFKEIQTVKELTGTEASLLYRYDTPQRLFGNLPRVETLKKERILTASEGELDEQIALLQHEIQLVENCDSVELEELGLSDRTLSFFLDDGVATEWRAAVIRENGALQLLLNKWKVKR